MQMEMPFHFLVVISFKEINLRSSWRTPGLFLYFWLHPKRIDVQTGSVRNTYQTESAHTPGQGFCNTVAQTYFRIDNIFTGKISCIPELSFVIPWLRSL